MKTGLNRNNEPAFFILNNNCKRWLTIPANIINPIPYKNTKMQLITKLRFEYLVNSDP